MENKWYKSDILWTVLIVFLFLLGFLYLDIFVFKNKEIVINDNTGNIIITPDIDAPTSTNQGNDKLLSTGNLLYKPYTPSQDVFTTNYEKDVVKLALDGKFKSAKLEVEGEVFNDGLHFMSMNFETVGGVINASRKLTNQLDLNETKTLGGVFIKGVPIKLVIDLKGNTIMAKTKEEFVGGKSGSKEIVLWDHFSLDTPTVIKFLFAPFNEYGQYGGAKITSINFSYSCEDGNKCGAFSCANNKMTTECLKNSFGVDAAKSWCQRSNLKECIPFLK